ncbi:hypothetical protein BpHYR1_001234 [Brachionus plicatilis]|uniref:Uncharacterized protein n=1 Tax=Brachionus plicatilis TaxID=10195 RepID=A0A3M7S4Y8_BRAPC|nr:hypothetical protein BpHYR1_001234 [Brachionus plicatilis]
MSKSSNQRSYSVAKNESNVCSDMDAVNALLSMKSRASSMPAANKGRRKQLLKPPTKRMEDDEDSDDLADELDTSDYDFEARDEDSADESMLHIDESVCESEDGSEKRKCDDGDDDDDQNSETRKKSKNESQMNPLLELSRAALIVEDQN